jgi:hypothetical protein
MAFLGKPVEAAPAQRGCRLCSFRRELQSYFRTYGSVVWTAILTSRSRKFEACHGNHRFDVQPAWPFGSMERGLVHRFASSAVFAERLGRLKLAMW